MRALGAFSDPWSHFYFQFSDLLIWLKIRKTVSNAIILNLSYMWFWSLVSLGWFCAIMCVKKSELSQWKPSNWGFLYVSPSDFLEIDVFIQYSNIYVKKIFYFCFFICFLATFSLSVFWNLNPFRSILEERNETLRTPNSILNQRKVFFRNFWNPFPSTPTVFVGMKIVQQINLLFYPFDYPSGGGLKLTVAINVERQRRKNYRLISAKIVAIWNPPLLF